MLENTEGPIKNGQSRVTGNMVYTRRRKKEKNTTQYVLHTTIPKQTQIAEIRHEPSYQQLEVKTNRTSLLCGNRNGTQNVKTHNRTTQKTKIPNWYHTKTNAIPLWNQQLYRLYSYIGIWYISIFKEPVVLLNKDDK
jgi:hypothetical protein